MQRQTGDWAVDLFVAVVRQAVKDARRGHRGAIVWLDTVFPEWRRYEVKQRRTNPTRRTRLDDKRRQGQNGRRNKNSAM